MEPLNPSLYRALEHHFGDVRLNDAGVEMTAIYTKDPGGKVRMNVVNAGEYYRIKCPFCNDNRYRLWINHRWGIRDSQTGTCNRWLAICYNENCLAIERNRVDLIDWLTWYGREARAQRVEIRPGRTEPVGRPIPLPRDFIQLDDLDSDHPVCEYVRSRGFDPEILASDWGVGFSRETFGVDRRLVIPIYRIENGEIVCWGWQSRAIDADEEKRCKYFTAPGLKRSQLLYGIERVDQGTGPVLICEGVTDVWRAGENAVALLGKYASSDQVRLIHKQFRGRPVVVLLDADAREDAITLVDKLRQARTQSILKPDNAPVIYALLADGYDPADYAREELWTIAHDALHWAASHQ